MCIFATEIDTRKVEQCGKHLYCPKLKFRQKIQRTRYRCLLLFRVCIGLPPLHIVKHRMKFFPVLFWNGVWRCLNFVKQATRVLCFPYILIIAPLRTRGGKKHYAEKNTIMNTDILKKLYDAVCKVLSPETKMVAFNDALKELDSILSSSEISSETLNSLGMDSSDWLRIKEIACFDHVYHKMPSHSLLSRYGIKENLMRMKTNLEKII